MPKAKLTQQYRVRVPCENDRTGKRFAPGAVCTSADFSADVIANWLEIGVLELEQERTHGDHDER